MAKTNIKKPKITEIVSIAAHQLKTPITVIKGYLEALISGDCGQINPFQKEYLSDALENVKRISAFIENLLDVSRIEANQFDLKIEPIAMEDISQQAIIELSMWIKASNCEISFKKPAELPKVLADEAKIRQVIQNLITNAIKYKTGRGKLEVNLRQKGKEVIFECKDNGIGIPKKDFDRVFSKFYRSEDAMELDPSGSGLGLYINKAIIEFSGGKIWFSKNKDAGMTFCFSLPAVKI